MDWKRIYKEKTVSAEEALSKIKSYDAIVPSHAAGEPKYLINKLMERSKDLEGVEIWQGLNVGDAPYAREEFAGRFINVSFFLGKNNRSAIQSGRGEFVPIHFYAQPRAIREGRIRCDVALIQCTPPNAEGYVNMSLSCDQTRVATETAGLSIAQVNRRLPWVCGDTALHVSEIDYFVEYDEDPYEIAPITADDPVSERIGEHIANLIDDGDCLQMGQGKIPNAILRLLCDKKDLGIHTEVFSDNLIPLIESGVVTGAKKSINKHKIIATFVQGSKQLYKYIDKNDMIYLKPVDYTNDVAVIAQNDRMVAINSAIEVDMMGQVVADSIGPKTFSGVGGQLDFLRGAEQSKGGKPIIALPATAKNGSVSRIVACLAPGTPVTTTRQDVHYVVTEYGVANLFGTAVRERAKQLMNIAAPQFREQIERNFFEYCKRVNA